MFNVTDAAAARCAQKLDELRAHDDECFRLSLDSGKPALKRSRPEAGETIFKHADRIVLAISPAVSESLVGRTLACRRTPGGPRLRLKRA